MLRDIKSKSKGLKEDSTAIISGNVEVNIIKKYISLFTSTQKSAKGGRFFRYLLNSNSTLKGSEKIVGRNSQAKFGIQMATYLNLPNPSFYTSHCFRTTSITIAADEGLTTQQMMALSALIS